LALRDARMRLGACLVLFAQALFCELKPDAWKEKYGRIDKVAM